MSRRATGRNWRLEIAAWAAALALLVGALALSAGRSDPETSTPEPSNPPREAPTNVPLP